MPRNILAPSILPANFLKLGDDIQACVDAGVDWFQLDVMDGHFVPNISFGPLVVKACRRASDAFLDVHLMISEPDRYLDVFAEAGADSLTVHLEAVGRLDRTLSRIRDFGLKSGVALNPDTPVDTLAEVIDLVDLVLVMTVNPGFGGQGFIRTSPEKISRARSFLNQHGSSAHLQVDGGIDIDTIKIAAEAGANVFVAGSAIFLQEEGIEASVKSLRQAISDLDG